MKKIFSTDFFIKQNGSYGSVTVFLTMILFPMLLLMVTLTDYTKITVAKNQISSAGELTMNAGLSYYDEYLKDMYGLFAVSKDIADLQENLENYFTATLEGAGVDDNTTFLKELKNIFSSSTGEDEAYKSLISLRKQTFSVAGITGANLTNTSILNNQIMDYMEYRGPILMAGGILDKISAFRNLKKETKAAQDKIEYETDLKDIENLCKNAYNAINTYNGALDLINTENINAKAKQINDSYQEANRYIFLIEQNENAKPKKITDAETVSETDLDAVYTKLKGLLEQGDYAEAFSKLNLDKQSADQSAIQAADYLYQYNTTVDAFNSGNIRGYGEALKDALDKKKQALQKEIDNRNKDKKEMDKKITELQKEIDNFIKELLKELKKDPEKEGVLPENSRFYKKLENFRNNYMTWSKSADDKSNKSVKKNKEELVQAAKEYYGNSIYINMEILEKRNSSSKTATLFGLYDDWMAEKEKIGDIQSSIHNIQEELNEKSSSNNQYVKLFERYEKNYHYFISGGEHYSLANTLYPGKENVKEQVKQGNDIKELLLNDIKEVCNACKEAKKSVDKVIEKMDELEIDKEVWQSDIDQLSGESKTSMQSDLDEEADMDKEQAQQCSDTLQAYEKSLENLKKAVKDIEFKQSKAETAAKTDDEFDCDSRRDTADWYFNKEIKVEIGESAYQGITPAKLTEENDDFYKYLKNLVDNSRKTEASEKKSSAESLRDTLLSNRSDSGKTSDDTVSSDSVTGSDAYLPSVEEHVSSETEMEKTSVNKDNSKAAMANDTSLLDLLTKEIDLKNSLNDLYLTEYIMNMFTYRTYHLDEDGNKKEELKTLSNYDYNTESVLHKAEAEYVLWGKDNAKSNQQATYTAIFGVRFLMNAIYALTNNEINTTTRAAAIAIAGFTGFGVPIVKTVMDLGLALLESKSDMDDLIEGKAVAIYKNSSTWKYSIQGAVNTVKNDIIKTAAQKAASMAIDKLQECVEDKLDEVTEDYINPYLEEITSNAIEGIIDTITKKVESRLSSISIADFASDDEIRQSIDQWTENFKSGLGVPDSEPDKSNVSDYILYISFQKINTNEFKNKMEEKVIELRDKADQTVDEKIEEYTNKIKDYVITDLCKIEKDEDTGKYTKIFGYTIADVINDATSQVKDEIKDIAARKAEDAKEKINDKISEYCNKLPVSKSNGGVVINKHKANKATAATLTMDYKEYLTMFLLLTGLAKSSYDAHLIRVADLIQINVVREKKVANMESVFKMSDCKTHFQIDVLASGGTVLGGNYYLQKSNGMYGVSYTGVEGY